MSRHGAFVRACFPASNAFRCASVNRCSTVSSDLHVSSWMSPIMELRFGMYSLLKLSSFRKARTPVMSVGGAISSSLVTSLGSGLRPSSDMMWPRDISEVTLLDFVYHFLGIHDVIHFLEGI